MGSAAESTDDRKRFELLYKAHFGAIYSYAMRRLDGRPDCVEDVVAETFALAWTKMRQIPEPPADRGWLYSVARNMVLRERRQLYHAGRAVEAAREEGGRQDFVSPADHTVESWFGVELMRKALETLPESDAEMLKLLHWDELSTSEVADLIGIPPSKVSLRVFRAKKRLRTMLTGDLEPAGP